MAKFPPDDEMPEGVDDLSPMASANVDYGASLSDDDAVRKIRRRTSTMGKVVTLVMLLGIAAMGYWWYTSSQKFDHRFDWRARANAAETDEQVLAILREQLPRAEHDDVKEAIILNLGVRYRDAQSVPL